MKKQKYYRIDKIKKINADYNILLGERSNGKSFAVGEELLINAWEKDMHFAFMRRWQTEVRPVKIEKYFEDKYNRIFDITNGECNCIQVRREEIFFAFNDGESIHNVKKCGEVMYLSGYVHFKSLSYPKVTDLIFEEFVPEDGIYLGEDEVDQLMSLVSTIARRRRIRVWMIANTISRMCPYFTEWQLKNIPKQKQGTIDTYEYESPDQFEEDGSHVIITIAVEFCENSGNNSKMFFGNKASMITNGAWKCKATPRLPHLYREYDIVYGIYVRYADLSYNMELLQYKSDNSYMIYVYPAKKQKYRRCIQSKLSSDIMTTDKLYQLTIGDKYLLSYLKLNKIAYSDNLTGSEFEEILNKIL